MALGTGHRGDVAAVLRRSGPRGAESAALPAARLVVADPPRSGLAREVVDYLSAAEHGAARFAYVSCDPATLARDIGLLVAGGWALEDLRAFDAFPMTHHVECVATLVTARRRRRHGCESPCSDGAGEDQVLGCAGDSAPVFPVT